MSWLFSRVLVEEYLEDTSLDGVQSAPLSGNSIPLAYLHSDKTTDYFRPFRYGMTFAPLTEDRGEGLLMWYREAFLAKTSAAQGQTGASPARGSTAASLGCGVSLPESSAKLHPSGCWLKTPLTFAPKVLDESSKIWPIAGMMLAGECYPLKTVEPITSESVCGLLPTPTTMGNQLASSMMKHRGCRELVRFLEKLPTPTAHNAKEGGYPAEGTRNTPTLGWVVGGKIPPTLTEWMMGWPIGWTDLKPLETDKFQAWQRQHSSS